LFRKSLKELSDSNNVEHNGNMYVVSLVESETEGNSTGHLCIDAYLQDSFPGHPGEVSALFNFFRTMSGFSVIYFQVFFVSQTLQRELISFQAPWLEAKGGFQVFGTEAG
jgi:hypothetical protein